MPHASLTPLGRQLRSVLANLRPTSYSRSRSRIAAARANPSDSVRGPPPLGRSASQTRVYHAFKARRSSAAVATVPIPVNEVDEHHPSEVERAEAQRSDEPRRLSRRRLNRRARVNRITEALKSAGYNEVAASTPKWKRDISHTNVRSRLGFRRYLINSRRLGTVLVRDRTQPTGCTLETILASFIRHEAAVANTGQAEWATSFTLTLTEARLLDARGSDLNDLKMWAKIISSTDSLEAAEVLEKHAETDSPRFVPLFVLLNVLRRPYTSQRALRIIIQQTRRILSHHTTQTGALHVSMNSLFLLFIRLVRHAREVWPRSLESLSELLLEYLPTSKPSLPGISTDKLQILTHMLNKAMRLLAVPTAFEPLKNNYFQEAAIIAILRFMAHHDPPLQINREGYRAVILLQLAQRKRPNEQQWAELKALSWPPWKEDRTAMDADITIEEHGMSKAADTLRRMQEAGYAPLMWERTAAIYTGWDVDRTPTIQTLVLLGGGGFRFTTEGAKWVARITATRTAQEAWACFLAYEEKKLPENQDVYLAIFRKLHQEEERQKSSKARRSRQNRDNERPIYPGDIWEVSALPPSTHLHTYTRTSPPTVKDLYRQLRERGVAFEAHCLAFLIANAGSLRLGIEYLSDSTHRHPQNLCLLHPRESGKLSDIPGSIFRAFIVLLSRFPTVPFPARFSAHPHDLHFHPIIRQPLDKVQDVLSPNHSIVRAVELLARHRPIDRSSWNAALRSLSRATTNVKRPRNGDTDSVPIVKDDSAGAVIAYKMVRRVHRMMREIHLDLDPVGFQALCWSVENLTLVFLSISKQNEECSDAGYRHRQRPHLARVAQLMEFGPTAQLRREFRILTGSSDESIQDAKEQESMQLIVETPQLLELPSPAVLHSYIRALGWMADYEGVRDTVRWMAQNIEELLLRCKQDRNGEVVMRRVIIAVRVFIERSWFSKTEASGRNNFTERGWAGEIQQKLRQLEVPASEDLIADVRAVVESVEEWGGWPDDEEVEEYCADARFSER